MGKKKAKNRTRQSYQSSYIIPLIAIFLGVFLLFVLGKTITLSLSGENVLGVSFLAKGGDDGSDRSSGSRSGSSGSSGESSEDQNDDSSGSGSSGSSGSGNTPFASPTKTETRDSSTGIRTRTEAKEGEFRAEVRLSESERITTRTKDGRTRIDITSGGIKTRLENRDDRIVIKAEQEDGTEMELEDNTIFKIEERLGQSGIKVATAGANRFLIQRASAAAITSFPLSIDLATNTLTIITQAGVKNVAVLPDQAVQNLLAANIVNRLGGQAIVNEVLNNNVSNLNDVITLGELNGAAVYRIDGISDQRLLGFIPVGIKKSAFVSAETGDVVSAQSSLVNRLLDFFSL